MGAVTGNNTGAGEKFRAARGNERMATSEWEGALTGLIAPECIGTACGKRPRGKMYINAFWGDLF